MMTGDSRDPVAKLRSGRTDGRGAVTANDCRDYSTDQTTGGVSLSTLTLYNRYE